MSVPHDPLREHVVGYPKLAAQIGILPELAIFRRFGALNAQNLLYMQAELAYLETKLKEQQQVDSTNPSGKRSVYALNWYWLKASEGTGADEQQTLILRIREVLKEYNDALIQQAEILKYPKPGNWDLHHMQNYLHSEAMGEDSLLGYDSNTWGSVFDRKSQKPDLVTLCPREKKDAFSTWAAENAIGGLFKCGCARFMKPSKTHGVVGYRDSTVYHITFWITSIVASLIPIASIVVLYVVKSMTARLGIIAAFNVLVSVCLVGFTTAKRADIFAITAAFAAVQVVFVGSDQVTRS
ncbi:hypothetical protein yc1106_03869 [Curvularia clavata]|uniref:DUF6594 domain-containing protein n=1 Tax=Curvularia clavata TaxID=95742 RepID=A0A9Q8Z7G4_CURCL|nr:hypothetical protein yc1106_03869 [Curvularia clavata]